MEYPITIKDIKLEAQNPFDEERIGSLCKVRPCDEKYEDKTFLGVYLGQISDGGAVATYREHTKILDVVTTRNAAIFVPSLKKIFYGAECFWLIIQNANDLREITDSDIQSQWYIQLLKETGDE